MKIHNIGMTRSRQPYDVDFSDVRGQENVRRALEVAAAGGWLSFTYLPDPGLNYDCPAKSP
jgi:predicted ATPase with chaperone activity